MFLIAVLFFSQLAIADNNQTLSLKINLNLENKQGKMALNNVVRVDTKNNHWTILGGLRSQKNNVVALSQVESADSKQAKIRFLILDTTSDPTIVSQPEMIVLYDQLAKLTLKSGKDELRLSVLASNK